MDSREHDEGKNDGFLFALCCFFLLWNSLSLEMITEVLAIGACAHLGNSMLDTDIMVLTLLNVAVKCKI